MQLLVATTNPGKLRELKKLLAHLRHQVIGLEQLENPPTVVEDGNSFCENATKKAVALACFSGCVTLADDSGLCVDVLNGAPGVHSARYAGAASDDAANNAKLLEQLATVPEGLQRAHFYCCIALAWPDGRCQTFSGRVDGLIIDAPRGTRGFGYDPLFLVPEYGKTMAELSPEIKNRISHRAKALQQVLPVLGAL